MMRSRGSSSASQTVGDTYELKDRNDRNAKSSAVPVRVDDSDKRLAPQPSERDAESNGGDEGELRPFSHGWRDPALAPARKAYLGPLFGGTMLTITVIMSVLSIYWGAFWRAPAHAHNLHVAVIDRDQGTVGQAVVAAFKSPGVTGASAQLTYDIADPARFSDEQQIIRHVRNENTWAAIVVASGVTTRLQSAVQSADASYNGSLAISVFFERARNENAVPTYVLGQIQGALNQFAARFALQHAQGLARTNGADLATLLGTAPSLVTRPVDYNLRDLAPFDVPVAAAVDFVGLIYLLVISFTLAMINTGARLGSGLDNLLTLRSLVAVRIAAPLGIYFLVSWFYAFISLAFQVPFSRFHGRGGFVIYWAISFFGMSALGLAVESLVTIMTVRFVPFFLILWIITNVSVAFYPLELLPGVFKYGYAAPFYHVGRAVRTILFGTKNYLGLNFGVLIAWVAFSCVTMTIFTVLVRRRDQRKLEARDVTDM
ncbi:hypothetical protein AURDEDRAFT_105676 [Auricularia subglabra TFB-10046 SS5]|nr:hypothetical protein AURDEDRAFT_105676 [Auricularia subglabra TFB-10046 SS5]